MSDVLPHFRAKIRIFRVEEGEPQQGFFGFPNNGVRRVPVEMDEVSGLNTVNIYSTPNVIIPAGDVFEANCRVIWEEGFVSAIKPGVRFRVWDGCFIASGEVLRVHSKNWKSHSA